MQTVLDTFEGVEGEFEMKVDTYVCLYNSLLADVELIKNEEKRLTARRKSPEQKADCFNENLHMAMAVVGKPKFKTPFYSFTIAKNGRKKREFKN